MANRARQQETLANDRLRGQVEQTDQARRTAEQAAIAEGKQRVRAEALVLTMQLQKAEDLLADGNSVAGLKLLGQILRENPSNTVAASRFASALLITSRLPLTPPLQHKAVFYSANFSPDGERVVTSSRDYTARVWDVMTGRPLTPPLRHGDQVYGSVFSPDGERIATTCRDDHARIWNARTGEQLGESMPHELDVRSVEFSPNGTRIVTGSVDKTARVWDAQTGHTITEPLRHEGSVLSALFSPDGLQVVTASTDKTARRWDARTGQLVGEPLRHEAPVNSAEFSPDGLRIATTSTDHTARVWDVFPAPVPVPAWFLDWAEARIGQRFGTSGADEAVPTEERRRQQELAAVRTDSDFYSRTARWVLADLTSRTLSPHASRTVPEYLQRRIAENTVASLREAMQLSPTNSLVRARLALALMNQDPQQFPERWVAAGSMAREALRLDWLNAEAWRAQATVELTTGGITNALASIERSLELDRDQREAWELKGLILTHLGRAADSLRAYQGPFPKTRKIPSWAKPLPATSWFGSPTRKPPRSSAPIPRRHLPPSHEPKPRGSPVCPGLAKTGGDTRRTSGRDE